MSTRTIDYRDAVEHLPQGGTLILQDVTWEDYEHLLDADRIIGRRKIDPNVDPPPDIAVEIDTTNESLSKFPIYSTLRVPEIWRYHCRHGRMVLYELRGESYAEIPASRSFPMLTGAVIADVIEQSKTQGHKAALSAFRRWVKQNKRKSSN